MRFKKSVVAGTSLVLALGGVVVCSGDRASAAGGVAAQVEISGNCDNPGYGLCAPPPEGVGLGGVWTWAALDTSSGSGTVGAPSPMDATASFCGHTTHGGGPGSAGGGGGSDPFGVWYEEPSLGQAQTDAGPAAFPFYDPSQYYGAVYVLDFFPGSGLNDFIAVVPVRQGHYSLHPASAVSIETQVAP